MAIGIIKFFWYCLRSGNAIETMDDWPKSQGIRVYDAPIPMANNAKISKNSSGFKL